MRKTIRNQKKFDLIGNGYHLEFRENNRNRTHVKGYMRGGKVYKTYYINISFFMKLEIDQLIDLLWKEVEAGFLKCVKPLSHIELAKICMINE
jgi:hypothetical protein